MMPRGYDRPLYIQPFDHRASFQSRVFGWKSPLSAAQTAEIAAAKRVIYDGFKAALAAGVPKEKSGILVDEQFGAAVLRDASAEGITTACCAEKSGQDEFDFEYGEEFAEHIEKMHPTFCKVLVRYNPEGDAALNRRQAARLKRLSDYLAEQGRSRFMFELLVPAEKSQLAAVKGDKAAYDRELRPRLMLRSITELQAAGVEPDLWKIEGLDRARIARRSWRLRAAAAATMSAASFSAAARTTPRFAPGSPPPPVCPASSALPWAAPSSGIPSWTGAPERRRTVRPSPRSGAATASSCAYSTWRPIRGPLAQLSHDADFQPMRSRQRKMNAEDTEVAPRTQRMGIAPRPSAQPPRPLVRLS